MYTVYCHIFPNGKRYIGITKTSLESRWDNGNSYKTCPLVDRAIKKYGWDNIRHEVLDTARSKQEAEEKERKYIAEYRCIDPEYGYNILPGGDVATNELTEEMRVKLGNGWRGKSRTDEEKKKISLGVKKRFERPESNGHYGMKHTLKARQKMSESHKKKWNNEDLRKAASERMRERMSDPEYKKRILDNLKEHPPSPRVMSEEEKKVRSEAMKGKWIGEKSPCSRPVIQYTKDGEFVKRWANAGEAERAGIALRSNIGKCCRHSAHCNTAGGYKWEYDSQQAR